MVKHCCDLCGTEMTDNSNAIGFRAYYTYKDRKWQVMRETLLGYLFPLDCWFTACLNIELKGPKDVCDDCLRPALVLLRDKLDQTINNESPVRSA